jgi:hypothetical protein
VSWIAFRSVSCLATSSFTGYAVSFYGGIVWARLVILDDEGTGNGVVVMHLRIGTS